MPGLTFSDGGVVEPEATHRARPQVLDDRVRGPGQPEECVPPLRAT